MPIPLPMPARRPQLAQTTRAAFTVCLFAAALTRTAGAQSDAFLERHAEELRLSGQDPFVVTFTNDRRAFRIGERIPVRLVFRHDAVPDWEDYASFHTASGLSIVVEGDGAHVDPRTDCYLTRMVVRDCVGPGAVDLRGVGTAVSRVVVGPLGEVEAVLPPALPATADADFELNTGVRFDRPGRYRLYLRAIVRLPNSPQPSSDRAAVSSVLTIDILPRDPAWEDATLRAALQVLDRPRVTYADNDSGRTLDDRDRRDRQTAALTLARLGTPAAIDALARLAYVPEHDESMRDTILEGLYAAPDRARVVSRLESRLLDPRQTMPRQLIEDMTVLDLTLTHRERPLDRAAYAARLRALAARRLGVLKAARRFDIGSIVGLGAGFADYPRDVERAIATLPPAEQRNTLVREAQNFRDPAFVPMLTRLASGRATGGAQGIAALLMNDIDPPRARHVILRELANRSSRLPIEGTRVIADVELPQFDDVFVRMLTGARTDEEFRLAIDRIERFASARIARRVFDAFKAYPKARHYTLVPPALAYFFRVDRAIANEALSLTLDALDPDEHGDDVLSPAASLRYSRALEDAGLALLEDERGDVTAEALDMLGDYGSREAMRAIIDAFTRWNERWKDRAEELRAERAKSYVLWDALLEYHFMLSLARLTARHADAEVARRAQALCLSNVCSGVGAWFGSEDMPVTLHVDCHLSCRDYVARAEGFGTVAALRGRADVQRWLRLLPGGTVVHWSSFDFNFAIEPRFRSPYWRPGELEAVYADIKAFCEARGLVLVGEP